MNVTLSLTQQPDGRWRWGVAVGMQEKEHGFEPSQLAAQTAGQQVLGRMKATLTGRQE